MSGDEAREFVARAEAKRELATLLEQRQEYRFGIARARKAGDATLLRTLQAEHDALDGRCAALAVAAGMMEEA